MHFLTTTLRIHCVGLAPEYITALHDIPPREGLHCLFSDGAEGFTPSSNLRCKDILLVNEDYLRELHALFPATAILLVQKKWEIPTPLLSLLADIWLVTDTGKLTFYFEHFLDRLASERKMHIKEHYLDALLATTPALIWFKNIQGSYFSVSDSFCKTVNKTQKEIEGQGHAFVWGMSEEEYVNSPLACKESDAQVLKTSGLYNCEELVRNSRGQVRTFSTWKNVIRDDDGTVVGMACVGHDVTDLSALSEEMRLLLSHLPFAVLITDEKGHIINFNDRFVTIFRGVETIVKGKTLYHASGDRTGDVHSVLKEELREVCVNNQEAEQNPAFLNIENKDICDPLRNRLGSLVIFRDITTEHNAQVTLEKTAYEDKLTGLYNRRHFYEKTRRDRAGGLIYLDLDHFKQINDLYGHKAGDQCLQAVGCVLKGIDSQASRLGGDEFVIYFNGVTLDALKETALQISQNLPTELGNRFPGITPSIGISYSESALEILDELVFKADAAMYINKRNRAKLWELEEEIQRIVKTPECSVDVVENLKRKISLAKAEVFPFTIYAPGMENEMNREVSGNHTYRLR